MKRVLLLTFLAICAIDAHAMEKKTQPFISVKQVVGAYDQIYSNKFRDSVSEYLRKLKMNASEAELRSFHKRFQEEIRENEEMQARVSERLRVTKKEIAENYQVENARKMLEEKISNAISQIERASEIYKKRNPKAMLGGEEERYTMDFSRARVEADEIKQKLVSIRDAGKTFTKQQRAELNAAAAITIF